MRPLLLASVACATIDVQIVVSRFNENVDWLNQSPFNTSRHLIYNKGPRGVPCSSAQECSIVKLPNVGREGHTYLYHIIENYDRLADFTIFLPGSALNVAHNKVSKTLDLMRDFGDAPRTIIGTCPESWLAYKRFHGTQSKFDTFVMNEYDSTDSSNKELNPERQLLLCPERPFGVWHSKNFPNIPRIKQIHQSGIFAVAKAHIVQHPIEYYQGLIAYLNTSSNPEAGHYFERSWGSVFHPYPQSNRSDTWLEICGLSENAFASSSTSGVISVFAAVLVLISQ